MRCGRRVAVGFGSMLRRAGRRGSRFGIGSRGCRRVWASARGGKAPTWGEPKLGWRAAPSATTLLFHGQAKRYVESRLAWPCHHYDVALTSSTLAYFYPLDSGRFCCCWQCACTSPVPARAGWRTVTCGATRSELSVNPLFAFHNPPAWRIDGGAASWGFRGEDQGYIFKPRQLRPMSQPLSGWGIALALVRSGAPIVSRSQASSVVAVALATAGTVRFLS